MIPSMSGAPVPSKILAPARASGASRSAAATGKAPGLDKVRNHDIKQSTRHISLPSRKNVSFTSILINWFRTCETSQYPRTAYFIRSALTEPQGSCPRRDEIRERNESGGSVLLPKDRCEMGTRTMLSGRIRHTSTKGLTMKILRKLPNSCREAPGLEWAILKKLPVTLLMGTLFPLVISVANRLFPPDGTRMVQIYERTV
jgi:hypothetical protein